MGIRWLSSVTLMVLGLAAASAGPVAAPDLAVGQQWTYRFGGKESDGVLKILAVGHHPRIGGTFDIQAESLPLSSGNRIPLFMRLSRAALENSVVSLKGNFDTSQLSAAQIPDLPVFETSVEESLRTMQPGLEAQFDTDCSFDREKLLALDQNAFDQDMNGGWRKLAVNPKCRTIAADLIRDYRQHHQNNSTILLWHEGQMRADAGETAAAIDLFRRSYKPDDPAGWNLYVDATIAFLQGDRAAFDAARAELAALPVPEWFKDMKDPTGNAIEWPINLKVVDGLGHCFGRPYREAYGNCPN